MKLILVTKPDMKAREINNVVQFDLCNMAELDGEISDSGWNFISILTRTRLELKKEMVRLEDVWQLSIVREEEEK